MAGRAPRAAASRPGGHLRWRRGVVQAPPPRKIPGPMRDAATALRGPPLGPRGVIRALSIRGTTIRTSRRRLGLLACVLLALPAERAAAQEKSAAPPAARPEDVASVDAILAAL